MTTNTASVNTTSNKAPNLSEMKENLKDGLNGAREQGVKSRRQSIGLAAMAYDEMKSSWADRERILKEAEERGIEVEADIGDAVQDFDEQVNAMMEELREQGPTILSELVNTFASKSKNETVRSAAGIFEKFATRFQEKSNRHAGTAAEKSQDIPISSLAKAPSPSSVPGVRAAAAPSVSPASSIPVTPSVSVAPWATYDDMTAKEIAAKVSDFSEVKKAAVRAYEAVNKNRVTVMRAASA